MLIDTHAHLSFPDFADDLTGVVERARQAGVERIVSIGTDIESSQRTVEIAGQFDGVYAAVGLHPGSVPEMSLCDMKELAILAGREKVVGIGETGLDYYRDAKDNPHLRQQQKDLLWAHLELAKERHLPVIIHNRSAEADLLEILRAHADGLPKQWRPWGVMHCFSGDERFAFDCIEIGLLISFTGILTFKKAVALRDLAGKVSLDHMMVETDSPYLAPVPHRGKRNEPSFVPEIARVLADVKGVSFDEACRITSANAERLFRFDSGQMK
jgi:TatD DNase family protein